MSTMLPRCIAVRKLKHSSSALPTRFSQSAHPPSHTPVFSGGTFRFQSMAPSSPYLSFNHAFVFWKCPQSYCKTRQRIPTMLRIKALTNPPATLRGLGCTLCSTQCLTLSNLATLFAAGFPHAKNTTPWVLFFATRSITFCVNFSHP